MTAHDTASAVIARASECEMLPMGTGSVRLLLDSSDTGGAFSAHRVHLAEGQLGANPHVHTATSELLYLLDGSIDVLAGDRVLTATAGDLVVAPPGCPHAFAASPGRGADALVMVTPGTERFEFFRAVSRAMTPGADPADRVRIMRGQDTYDTHAVESAAWSSR